jgi:hypothetical protein
MSRWDALLAVQEHDTTADQLDHRKRTLPARVELDGVMTSIATIDQRTTAVEAARHELQRVQQRLEDDIATIAAKAKDHEKILYGGTVGNPRELQAMQDEIAALRKRIGQLEDQELELMEQIEPLDQELAALVADRDSADARGAGLRAAIAEAEVEIDAEVVANQTERDGIAAGVDPDLLEEYEKLRPRSGGIAIARLVGGSCGGCHLQLSAVEVARIKKLPPEEPANCEECGRLLAR